MQDNTFIENTRRSLKKFELCYGCYDDEAKFRCGDCKERLYCRKLCQKRDWYLRHKKLCPGTPLYKGTQKNGDESNIGVASLDKYYFILNEKAVEFTRKKVISIVNSCKQPNLNFPPYHKEYQETYPDEEEHYHFLKDVFYHQMLETIHFEELARCKENYRCLLPESLLKERLSYPKLLYQIFRNTPAVKTTFEFGKTYVFIGYVDLLECMMGDFIGNGDKVNVYGFEQSGICAARSLIIYEMMKMKKDVDSILEVWFSTGWSEKTSEDFHSACGNVVTSSQPQEVRDLIDHWKVAHLSLNKARLKWKQGYLTRKSLNAIANLIKKQDRVEFCRYQLTGQIFGQLDLQIYGNVTMFSLTPVFEEYLLSAAYFFNSFSFKEKELSSEINFIECVTQHYKSKLQQLVKLVAESKVEITLSVMDVQLENKEAVNHIQSLKADYIDWNNIGEYMEKEKFFELASACSTKETIHSQHFMNWFKRYHGVRLCHFDNFDFFVKSKKAIIDMLGSCAFLRKDDYFDHHSVILINGIANQYINEFVQYHFKLEEIEILRIDYPEISNPFFRMGYIFHASFQFK